jgi:hypothetical protein
MCTVTNLQLFSVFKFLNMYLNTLIDRAPCMNVEHQQNVL